MLGLVAFSHAYSWGKVTLVGPGVKETKLAGAAGAVLIPAKSSGYIETGITPGAVFKSAPLPAPYIPEPVYAAPAPVYAPAPFYAPAPVYKYEAPVLEPIAYAKGEALISGPSGKIEAGPGKAYVVGPTGPNYGGYDGKWEGGWDDGDDGSYKGEGGDGDDGSYKGEGKKW